jgi:hypothetical protein
MNNWNDLLTLILIVFAIYLILSLCIFLILKQLKKRRINDYYFTLIRKVRLFYKPSGWLIILGGFISLDPTTHGLLALILGAFFFNPMRNYISGLFIRASPMVVAGTLVQAGKIRGRINRISTLGMVLGTDQGERWVWYSSFDRVGFTLISNQTNVQQRAIYLKTPLRREYILDLIFSHPVVALGQAPNLKSLDKINTYLLHYTLVKGTQNEDFINFLHAKEILTNQTEKFDN